jgi:uncharacterized membrane protein
MPTRTSARPAVASSCLLATEKVDAFHAVAAIAAVSFLVVTPFLIWGYPHGAHDFDFHVSSWMQVAQQWQEGILVPRWAQQANYGYGEPRFLFYPPLSLMLGAALSLLLPWQLVPGAYVLVVLVTGGGSMFLLARDHLAPRYALAAALAYVINPYQLLVVYWRWAAAEMLVGALFPLLLACCFSLGGGSRRAVAGFALVFAAIWLSNVPGALVSSYSIGLLLLVMAAHQRSLRTLIFGAAAIAIGLALASFFLLPAWREQPWVQIQNVLAPAWANPERNFVRLVPQRERSINAIALTNLVLGVTAGAIAFQQRRRMPRGWWLCVFLIVVAVVFMIPVSAPLWKYLPKLRFVQFPWRWLFSLNTGCALLLGAVLAVARPRQRKWALASGGVIFLVLLAVVHAFGGRPGKITSMQSLAQQKGGYTGFPEYTPPGGAIRENSASELFQVSEERRVKIHLRRRNAESLIFDCNAEQASQVRIALSFYPAWGAQVNGQPVQPSQQDGLLVVAVPAGQSEVRINFVRTPDRLLGGILSLIGLAAVLLVAAPPGAKPQKIAGADY